MMSLAQLMASQGKYKQAHAILSNVFGWFTEGFGRFDLQQAKRLLDELS